MICQKTIVYVAPKQAVEGRRHIGCHKHRSTAEDMTMMMQITL